MIQQAEAERKGLALGDELPPYPIPVWIDASRINQVVTNLVTNAINHTPEGGSVTIRTFLDARGYAVVQVQDTGVGISPEHLPHIFQPFFQVHNDAGGSGLGLSIAKEIVELHGGRLTVESEVGRGTCFSMWLRVAEGAVGSGA